MTSIASSYVALGSGSFDFIGGKYLVTTTSINLNFNTATQQFCLYASVDSGTDTIIANLAYFGTNTVLNGSVSPSRIISIPSGSHKITIGGKCLSDSKTAQIQAWQTVYVSIIRVGD